MIYDIIVVGGGIAGAVAAIASARTGANTLLVEQYGFLGGQLTTAGVGPMMTFHAGEKLAVQGITNELIRRMQEHGKSPGHIYDTTGYTYSVTPFDAEGMKHELEMMLLESGGRILYHTMLAGVETENGRVTSIRVCNKAGLSDLKAKVYVDGSGDADLSAWAGVAFIKGRKLDGACQPMTMNVKVRNVNIAKVKEYIKAHNEEFPRLKGDLEIVDQSPRLSIGGFVVTFKEALDKGELNFERKELLLFETNNPGEVIVNSTRVVGRDGTDPWDLSYAETEGRRQVREIETFLKKRIAGFEECIIDYSGPKIGVRSSRHILGEYVLTLEDLVHCVRFDDVIAHGGYPVDIHPPKEDEAHQKLRAQISGIGHFRNGEIYSIPYRSLINRQVKNLITVGRCISTTFEAQGAIRVTPIAGAIGHAGGAAAGLAARQEGDFTVLDVKEVQALLKEQGAYLEI